MIVVHYDIFGGFITFTSGLSGMREKATSILLPGHFDHMLGRKKLNTKISSICIALEVNICKVYLANMATLLCGGSFAGPWFFCDLHDGVITGLKAARCEMTVNCLRRIHYVRAHASSQWVMDQSPLQKMATVVKLWPRINFGWVEQLLAYATLIHFVLTM